MASKMSCRAAVMDQCELLHSFSYSLYHSGSFSMNKAIACRSHAQFLSARICSSSERFWCSSPYSYRFFKKHTVVCFSTGTRCSKAKEYTRSSNDSENISRDQLEDGQGRGYFPHSSQGLAEACRFVYNDAKYVNERACNNLILLSRGITRLNDCARQHIAVLGLGFLELDVLITMLLGSSCKGGDREDWLSCKRKAANLHHIATILRDKAQSNLKRAAVQHWSDGALEVDLRQADSIVRRRAMKDAYVALKVAEIFLSLIPTFLCITIMRTNIPLHE